MDAATSTPVRAGLRAAGLVVDDLLSDLSQLSAWLTQTLTVGDALDAYLLVTGAVQIAEDHQHPDLWSLRRVVRALTKRGLPDLLAWLLLLPVVLTELVRSRLPGERRTTRWLARLRRIQQELAPFVVRGDALDPATRDRLTVEARQARAVLDRLPARLRREVLRLPSCFRSFDQRPADQALLAARLTAQHDVRPAVVVGVRTSGSYLAPLTAAALADLGVAVEVLTVRPGRPLHRTERRVLARAVREHAHVVVVDDPPVTGDAVARAMDELRVPSELMVLLVQTFEPELPERLHRRRAVTLPLSEWTVQSQLAPDAVRAALTDLWGPAVVSVERLPLPALGRPADGRRRGHLTGLYRVQLTGSPDRLVAVDAVGVGYLGRHALAVAEAVPDFVPHLHGLRDGLLFREWVPAEHRVTSLSATTADQIGRYIAVRERRLATRGDRSRGMTGRAPVWEVAGMLLSTGYGRLGPPLQLVLLDAVARRLTGVASPSVVDGDTGLRTWFTDGARAVTIGADHRAFSNLDLACYDAAYDVAGVDPGGPAHGIDLVRRSYEQHSGHAVDDERLLLYQLVHLFDSERNHHITRTQARRAAARSVQRYVAGCYLADLHDPPEPEGLPLVAIDCDGVLETDAMGFAAISSAGALALRSLVQHSYRPVLVTGRSLDEVRERCESYGLAGGVAEYGSVAYRHDPALVVELLEPQQRSALLRLRAGLEAVPGVEVDPDYTRLVRASLPGGGGQRRGLGPEDVATVLARAGHPAVQVIQGDGQTDFVAVGVDKGRGLAALQELLGSHEVALAVGDTASDLPALHRARLGLAPGNATAALHADPTTRVLHAPYQAGLASAVRHLVGHRPGGCELCPTPDHSPRRRLMLAALSAPERGRGGLPAAAARTTAALAASSPRLKPLTAVGRRVPLRRGIRAALVNPLFRSGHALLLSSVLTAGVGLAFWLVAAHRYSPAVVGRNSAAISAMMFLAGLAQLNLMSSLLRFVPTAGRRAPRLVGGSYLVGALTSAAAATVFLAGLGTWAPQLAPMVADPLHAVWFVVSAAAWAVFVMQDSVLVAVRRAWMVPTENVVFSLLKLGLLIAFAGALASVGIFAAWTVAAVLAVVGTTGFLALRALPAHARAGGPPSEVADVRTIARFTAADYVGASFWIAATALMPVLVLDLAGASAAAAFAMAWTITLGLYQVPVGMGQSLVVHAVHDQTRLDQLHRQALVHSLRLLAPVVAVVVIAAPELLEIFGPVYETQGAWVLRLLALSALPQAVTALAVSKGRVQRRMRFVVTLLGTLCTIVLVVAVALLPVLGIVGVGIAWLVAQSAVAAVLLSTRGRSQRDIPRQRVSSASSAPTAAP